MAKVKVVVVVVEWRKSRYLFLGGTDVRLLLHRIASYPALSKLNLPYTQTKQ